ncbi:LysR family transcriptional regulator [Planomonospora parontospora subsp. parontospora]|uniref:LysR family transcriptional regulator n=2 Tax=Planomonospora parontospora TaxID=58119 RepID=A0AA37F3V1_9ACTN|nr:LysR family transcriptional regulator [Planomonospora parontospora]GGK59735.1 LysR family transcriptional regulator [Planomonospora parontospora]GII08860.1 LysR family transcriptional regulator [Planomonospora parontospora subsp. parontospora]
MLDLRRLALICEFARKGSIAATAASLGYSPSAVSQQLAALERESGATLIDRTARSAELTDAGRRLVEHAERILAMVEAAESDLSAQAGTPSGRVTVTAFPTAAVAFAPALARLLRRHTALTLRMVQGRSGRGAREVQSGTADIAVVDDWYGRMRESETMRVFPLLRDPLVLVVPRTHRLASPDEPVDLAELRDEPWMATPDGEPSRMAVDRMMAEVGGAGPVPWEFEGLSTVLSLVAKGVGIAAVPALALAAGVRGIAVREIPGTPAGRDVHAVVRASSVHRPAVAVTLRAVHTAARYLAADLTALEPEVR